MIVCRIGVREIAGKRCAIPHERIGDWGCRLGEGRIFTADQRGIIATELALSSPLLDVDL